MTEYERQRLFYEQFNTVVHNHQEWLKTPQGTLEVLADHWKAHSPVVRIDSPFEQNAARDILAMIRARQQADITAQATAQEQVK